MNTLNHSISYLTAESVYARIARFSFLIYLFFVIFGTMLPFQGSLQERGELGQINDSNIVNQLLSLLFLLSFISLSGKLNAAFAFIQKEKFLNPFSPLDIGERFMVACSNGISETMDHSLW